MPATAQPYLNFEGRCEEAFTLYKKALGAEIKMLIRCDEAPGPSPKPGLEKKILHSEVQIGANTLFMTDGYNAGNAKFDGISIAVNVSDEGEAKAVFNALADGGSVTLPLSPSFFSPCFGMVKDKFGLGWMIMVPQAS